MDAYGTTLPEDLLLLCASPKDPRNAPRNDTRLRQPSHFRLALAGGTLAELLAAGVAALERNRLVLLHPGPLGHPALDAAVTTLSGYAAPPRGARVRSCVNRLSRRAAEPYLQSLVDRGLAQRRVWKLLGLIPITQYTVTDRGAAAHKLAAALVTDAVDNPEADPRSLQLAALAHAVDLTRRLYPGPVANRRARQRLAALTRQDPVASAVHAAVRAAKDVQTGSG
ncbi:GPP34 family phosphoprotein [Streptacidiphilus sp. N1-3]|uniref:GPP34 family phosphoprotein n=1 Tax=Streptacidiphilus alkalitolerans TaxID=3342712 RepID=A0ABV6WT85_9ACTN